jgi:hypothetical protein
MSFIDDDGASANALDMASIDAEIVAGARAFNKLLTHATDDWTSWSITIIGLRALRSLAFAEAHTSDVKSYAYRQKIGELLEKKKYSALAQIDKQTRSTATNFDVVSHLESVRSDAVEASGRDRQTLSKEFCCGRQGRQQAKAGEEKAAHRF